MYSILICDDEKDIVKALTIYLSNANYNLLSASDGEKALEIMKEQEVDLVLLDIMMPRMDGLQALVKIREFSNIPVILLTAKSEESDIILGLNLGADDYITKPFNPLEVCARVNSQLRRFKSLGAAKKENGIYETGPIVLDDNAKRVLVDGEEIDLTPKEFEILKLLIKEPGTVFSPKDIYRAVWGENPLYGSDNIIAVHIRHLREKIEIDPNEPRYLTVVFGQGYKLAKGRGQ